MNELPWNLLASLGTASLHEAAGRIGALPSNLRPLDSSLRLCGPALTVRCMPGNNLSIHQALYVASPGDVLVVSVGNGHDYGYWGEILTVAAKARAISGIVLDGGVRDTEQIKTIGMPVFADRISIRGTEKGDSSDNQINVPIQMGDVRIEPGDLVVGDADGVVVIPRADAERTASLAHAREEKEATYLAELKGGRTTLEILGLNGTAQTA